MSNLTQYAPIIALAALAVSSYNFWKQYTFQQEQHLVQKRQFEIQQAFQREQVAPAGLEFAGASVIATIYDFNITNSGPGPAWDINVEICIRRGNNYQAIQRQADPHPLLVGTGHSYPIDLGRLIPGTWPDRLYLIVKFKDKAHPEGTYNAYEYFL